MARGQTASIAVGGVDFAYPRSAVFADFSFESAARVTMLRGPSGCGKTTLIKLLYGLYAPSSARTWEVPAPAFLVLQSDSLVPWFTGRENIERFSPELWAAIKEGPMFDMIEPLLARRACDMSYGQRRTIELVRAFSVGAPLLLLDEPFNFLDSARRRIFLDHLNSRTDRSGQVVLTTHYVEEIPIEGADCFEFVGELPHRRLTPCSGGGL